MIVTKITCLIDLSELDDLFKHDLIFSSSLVNKHERVVYQKQDSVPRLSSDHKHVIPRVWCIGEWLNGHAIKLRCYEQWDQDMSMYYFTCWIITIMIGSCNCTKTDVSLLGVTWLEFDSHHLVRAAIGDIGMLIQVSST